MPEPEYLTVRQVAERFQKSPSWVVRRIKDGWCVAWIKDRDGEIYQGKYKFASGRLLLRSATGKQFEGFRDGKTSWKDIEWFPDVETTEFFEWRNPGAPKITSHLSVCRKCGM